MKRIKLRVDSVNAKHVHCSVFIGEAESGSVPKCGDLVFDHFEYLLFATCLILGTGTRMGLHLKVDLDESKWTEWNNQNLAQQ